MYIRRVENLILDSRVETENEEFTDNTGIQDDEFIRYFNDAQEDLQSAIARAHQNVFIAEAIRDVVVNQEAYALPDDIYLDNRISAVWFSDTGSSKDRRRLQAGSMIERVFDKTQNPALYIRSTNELILTPVPGQSVANGLFFNYVRRLSKIDKRRGQVLSFATSGNALTALTLDPDAELDADALLEENYLSVVNRDGDRQMQRIPFTEINQATGVVTLVPGFEFKAGESIAVGDYVVRGRFGANRSEMPTNVERYLIAYTNWKILKRDSSTDSAEQSEELRAMRGEIVNLFNEIDDDEKNIAIKNTQFLDDDDLFIFF